MDEFRVIFPISQIQQTPSSSAGTIRIFYYEAPITDQQISLPFGFKICGTQFKNFKKERGEHRTRRAVITC